MNIDTSKPVMVTGATGYVAGWIIKRLLDEGVTVHATLRDSANADKRAHLDKVAEAAPGTLRYFDADLLDDGAFAEAMQGCSIVFHTASPFVVDVKDPQRDLVDPALLGTRNVLEQVNKTPSVERVVLTSSVAAIYGDNADVENSANGTFTEEEWNTTSSLEHQAYSYSKKLAEEEAWKINGQQDRWRLVCINPALVIGPGLNPRGTSESFRLIKQLGNGTMAAGAPRWAFGLVDVRDVAEAHLKAAYLPEAQGRHIIFAESKDFLEMGQLLRPHFPKYPLPRFGLPKPMAWLFGPLANKALTRKIVMRNVGVPFRADNSKGIRELGMRYRPAEESLREFFQQLIDAGRLKKR